VRGGEVTHPSTSDWVSIWLKEAMSAVARRTSENILAAQQPGTDFQKALDPTRGIRHCSQFSSPDRKNSSSPQLSTHPGHKSPPGSGQAAIPPPALRCSQKHDSPAHLPTHPGHAAAPNSPHASAAPLSTESGCNRWRGGSLSRRGGLLRGRRTRTFGWRK
jgi:hypothetical protein